MGYASGSSEGNMMGMRSGIFPMSENCCTNRPDRSWFGIDDGKPAAAGGEGMWFAFNVSGGLGTVSVASSGAGPGRAPVVLSGTLSSMLFDERLPSLLVVERDNG